MAARDPLAQTLKQMLNNCVGFSGDDLDNYRKQAYDYYFQRPRGDEIAGRSSIVTGDLSAMVEGNLALMVEPLTSKRIAEFCAYSPDDEEQAQLESDCVSHMLFKRQNGFIESSAAIKDALLLRNAVVKVYVDKRTFKQTIRRKGVGSAEAVVGVLDQIGEVDVHKYDAQTQTLSATVTKNTSVFRVESLAPENFLFPKNWHRSDLDGIPFCAERHVEPRSTLIERGFKKTDVDQLRRWNNQYNAGSDARLPRSLAPTNGPVADKGQELVEWFECYVRMTDSAGSSELRCIAVSGNIILDDEPADSVCYACGVVIINPHTFIGISLHDKLKSTQDSTTALTRGLMDNLNATSKSRTAHLEGVVDIDALQDGRINNSVGVDPSSGITDVRQALSAFQVPDTSANILQNLQHMARIRSEMGGATLDMSTGQMQLNDRLGSQGLDRAYSVMEQLAAFMTRMIANTLFRQMYLIAHEVLRTEWREPIEWKRGKTWLKTEPASWPMRQSVEINLGASAGERARLSVVYEKLMAKQEQLAQLGMEDILVNVQNYYTAFIDWLRVNDIPNPENYMMDPRLPASTDTMKRKAQMQQLQQQKQDGMVNSAIALEQVRSAITKYTHDSQLQFDYFNAVLNAEIEEAKMSVNAVVDLTKTRATANEAANAATDKSEPGAKETGSEEPAEQSAAA
jgi:hypothetical protein